MLRPLLLAALLVCTGCSSVRPMPEAPPEVSEDTPQGCTLLRFSLPSPSMQRLIKVAVLLPPAYGTQLETRFPVLYALHGRGAPYDTWTQMPKLRAALADQPMIVVTFDADAGSWYLDAPLPQTRWLRPAKEDAEPVASLFTTFFFAELLPAIERRFRTDPQRRMLTGFSMGGYGAFHYLLTRPEAFVSVSTLSGAFMSTSEPNEALLKRLPRLLGPWPEQAERYRAIDLQPRFADAFARGVRLPPIRMACGAEDKVEGLLAANRAYVSFFAGLGIAADYIETPGAHDWAYWSAAAPDLIDFHWRTLPAVKP